MGIPAAFRWLSTKYPKIISPVVEELPKKMDDDTVIPVDTTRPNPNGEEFDNLYLDMNGIVHPCSHPEDRPAPQDEEEMMLEIFKYTDRVVNMVRPRKLLMIAVDGVAPRAKMNQQRSRRFRSAQEAMEKEKEKEDLLQFLRQKGGGPGPDDTGSKKAFDSNAITPGTPFMDTLAASLRYWCSYKLNTDPAWAKMKVIISDATVPGEGEHKIMEFVRSQRASPDHDPNTRHVIYGLDADLIMLGLATHEPHFRVLREDVFAQDSKVRMCKICGQKGHEALNCTGAAKQKEGDFDEREKAAPLKPFIWLHVAVLREYLAVELDVPGLPFKFDLERAIDDWVFMCFFVGNDFLPHLPALEIRENAIDTLTAIWRDNLPHMGGYMTKDGEMDPKRTQFILNGLAKQENAIFQRRKESEDKREAGFAKRRRLDNNRRQDGPPGMPREAPRATTHDVVMNRGASAPDPDASNKSAASIIRDRIKNLQASAQQSEPSTPQSVRSGTEASGQDSPAAPAPALGKRKASRFEEEDGSSPASGTGTPNHRQGGNGNGNGNDNGAKGEGPVDEVRLWEDGYADRYYEKKFHVDPKDIAFRHKVARSYVEGLAWVLKYYFQGCPSWEWFYPYHYAPFAADFINIGDMEIKFEKGRTSRPFEQLMSVLPAASRHSLPEVFHDLMLGEDSEIIDFYPEDFQIDLNGKKMAWQGVALLPFIEMPRLLRAMEKKYPLLSPEETARNDFGRDVLIFSEMNRDLYDDITTKFYSKKQGEPRQKLDPKLSQGLAGKVIKMADYLPHGNLEYPLERDELPSLDYDGTLTVEYKLPPMSHSHKSMMLRGAILPQPVLTPSDIQYLRGKTRNAGRGYGGAPLDRDNGRGGRQNISYAPDGGRSDRYGGGRSGGRNGSGGGGGYNPGPYNSGPPPRGGYDRQSGPAWIPPPGVHAGYGVPIPPPPPLAHPYNGYHSNYPPPRHPPPGDYRDGGYGRDSYNNGDRHPGAYSGSPPPRDNGGYGGYGGYGGGGGGGGGQGGGHRGNQNGGRGGGYNQNRNWRDHNR